VSGEEQLRIQLYFDNPLEVSADTLDTVKVEFLADDFFVEKAMFKSVVTANY